MYKLLAILFFTCWLGSVNAELAFEGAEGFGANSKGGKGGQIIKVTRLDDNPNNPKTGSFRWAVNQKGPRIVQFDVSGNISLQDRLVIEEPFLTIDGSTAPDKGICIKNYGLEFSDTHDIIVRYIRVRHGDVKVLEENKKEGRSRPEKSVGLDCINIDTSKDVIVDHCSLSWSCDEVVSVTRSENVTIQWCFITEPLANPKIHPYGDEHAYGFNASANTLSVHHCLFANYVMRGPQFETNDVDANKRDYDIKMEAVNNLIYNYTRSGSRYTTGVDNPDQLGDVIFQFQYINNLYVNKTDVKPEINVEDSTTAKPNLKVFISGNIGPIRSSQAMGQYVGVKVGSGSGTPILDSKAKIRGRLSYEQMFSAAVPISTFSAESIYPIILENAGCNLKRDSVDERIIKKIKALKFEDILKSQEDVGGWPDLS
ncbi:MAG: hypothetical protein WC222_00720 [Parachlamydiales bacterium]|jgi:hypothetical protein